MDIACIGGGAGGLYFAISAKLRNPTHRVIVYERNRPRRNREAPREIGRLAPAACHRVRHGRDRFGPAGGTVVKFFSARRQRSRRPEYS